MSKSSKSSLTEMLQSAQVDLANINVELDQLERLQKRQIELRAVIVALTKLQESQGGPGAATVEAFIRPRMLEERRALTLEFLLDAEQPLRFTEILSGLRALHGPGISKNHVTAVLKDPRFDRIAVKGKHPRWRAKFSKTSSETED